MKKALSFLVIIGMVLGISAFQCASTELTSAKLYIQQKNLDKAKETLQTEVSKNPKSDEGFYLLGYVYGEEENIEEMLKNFNKSVAISNKFENEITDYKKYQWQDNFNRGVGLFNRATKTAAPDTSKMYYDKSITAFQNAILCEPDSVDAYKNLSFSMMNANREEEAIESLKKIIELDGSAGSYSMLGEVYFNEGVDRMNAFQDTKNVDDSIKGTQYYKMAIGILEHGLEAHPNDPDILLLLSNSYVAADELDEAMVTFKKGVEQDPGNKYYRYNYGVLLLGAEEFESAVEQFNAAIDIDPEYTNAHYNLGVAYVKMGVALREKAVEEDSGDESYKEIFQSALAPLNKYLELKPDDTKVWEILGKVYANLGMTEESKEAFEKADQNK